MPIHVLDPTSEANIEQRQAAARLTSLKGKTIGLISNGKEGTAGFFAHLEKLLYEQCDVAAVVLRIKSNYSAPADSQIIEEAASWDGVISGIGD
jgi:hypothetical protein